MPCSQILLIHAFWERSFFRQCEPHLEWRSGKSLAVEQRADGMIRITVVHADRLGDFIAMQEHCVTRNRRVRPEVLAVGARQRKALDRYPVGKFPVIPLGHQATSHMIKANPYLAIRLLHRFYQWPGVYNVLPIRLAP